MEAKTAATHPLGPNYGGDALISAASLSRSFSGKRAVDDLELELRPGECLALFGPNGAGKTTLLRLIAGLLRPSAGNVSVGGMDPRSDTRARSLIGFISHHTMLYDELTAAENLELAATLGHVTQPLTAARAMLELLGAAKFADTRVKALSRGAQQRVAVARALVHQPRVVLADEPFTSVDEQGNVAVRAAFTSVLARGGAVIVVTHNLMDGLALATRVVVMNAGRFVREDERTAIDPVSYAHEYGQLVSRAA
jgi:heme exporter protein A